MGVYTSACISRCVFFKYMDNTNAVVYEVVLDRLPWRMIVVWNWKWLC